MATRSAFNDDSYSLSSNDGSFVEEVDLTVMPWNRTTVADGQWLNDRAIAPLSARDVYLADCIDSVISSVNTLIGRVNKLDSVSSDSRRAGSLTTVDKAINFAIGASNYDRLRSTESDYFIPNNSFVTYSVSNSTNFAPVLPAIWEKDGFIMQQNLTDKAMQLLVTTGGNFAIRTIQGDLEEDQSNVSSEDGTKLVYHYQKTNDTKWDNVVTIPTDTNDGIYGISYNKTNNTYTLTAVNAGGTISFTPGNGLTANNTLVSVRTAGNNIGFDDNGNLTAKDTTYAAGTGLTADESNAFKLDIPGVAGTYVVTADANGFAWTTTSFTESFTAVSTATDGYLSGNGTAGTNLGIDYTSLKTSLSAETYTFSSEKYSDEFNTPMTISAAIQKLIDIIDGLTPEEDSDTTTGG